MGKGEGEREREGEGERKRERRRGIVGKVKGESECVRESEREN